MAQTPGPVPQRDPQLCVYCEVALQHLARDKFRVGGTSGAAKMFFGEWAELGEQQVEFDLWACPQCRTVVFRIPA